MRSRHLAAAVQACPDLLRRRRSVAARDARTDALLAELTEALARPGAAPVRARLLESEARLVLELDDPLACAAFDDAPALLVVAESLAARGLVVDVVGGGRHLVSLGAVSAPWWQRRITGTRRIRVGHLRSAWRTSAPGAGAARVHAVPVADAVPPPEQPPLGLVS